MNKDRSAARQDSADDEQSEGKRKADQCWRQDQQSRPGDMAGELKDDEDNGQKFSESHVQFKGNGSCFGCRRKLEDIFQGLLQYNRSIT